MKPREFVPTRATEEAEASGRSSIGIFVVIFYGLVSIPGLNVEPIAFLLWSSFGANAIVGQRGVLKKKKKLKFSLCMIIN